MRRVSGLLKVSRGADAAERLHEFLNNEELEGDGRSSDERALLENVLRMRDLRVDDVMVPRADIVAIDVDSSLDDTLSAFREGAHSRLPVYRETLDDPLGVVHLKDVALSHGFGPRSNDFQLSDHLRTVLAVPPSMRLMALLQRMQATRRHMALVIDEYGGVD
ncbi:MAG: CBS domain-containing protein, partial [Rhodobacteraceae bacterium]|nr:CBS domain-containing protein [Paracoccaceae bacterium]